MNKNYKKLTVLLGLCVAFALVILISNNGITLPGLTLRPASAAAVTLLDETSEEPLQVTGFTAPRALVLYSPLHQDSVDYQENILIALEHLHIEADTLELSEVQDPNYPAYDMVILASAYWEEELTSSSAQLMDYVEDGGKLFLATVPESIGSQFDASYRRMGIVDFGDYLNYNIISFAKELLPGLAGRSFSGESFSDVALSVTLESNASVYAWAQDAQGRQTPLIWSYDCGQGRVTVFNSTSGRGDFWRGILAGCINTLSDTVMYPVINALCLFIDDFPSPQYESESDVVREEYNRSAREFYRDIWWPDMLQIAKAYGDVYTGLFVATYNAETDPAKLTYTQSATERYFGVSLLKNGYEMGAHGYNHQPLTAAGGTPDELNYTPWNSEQDMEASLRTLVDITAQMFPTVTLCSYVPPSNYLSEEGRRAVVQALPDLEVISGIYTNEDEQGDVYVQDFTIAEDGIAEFPRVTSGMAPDDYEQMSALSALGLYGAVSHFIHPDDIFDDQRGGGKNWEELYRSYCTWIGDIHQSFPWLRSLSATEAGDALRICYAAEPHLLFEENQITGSVENFLGPVSFYLKTDHTPKATDDACSIRRISAVSGTGYYLVTVQRPNFSIRLVTA